MTIESSSTKKCPDCAEDVMIGAGFCPYCGYSFAAESAPVQRSEGAPALPPPPSPAWAPMAAPRASAPVGEMREGIVGSARTKLGEVLLGASVAVMVLAGLAVIAEVDWLAWGERITQTAFGSAWEYGYSPGFVSGAVVVAIVAAFGIRALMPRLREVGAAARRGYRRRLKSEYGISSLHPRRGTRGCLAATGLLLIGLGALVVYQLGNLRDEGYELKFGVYLAGILVVVALVGVVLAWPSRSAEIVYMDKEGNIHRSGK
jgi:hypothetical protein